MLAAELLRSGQLVAIPTETVYGLAARIDDPSAIAEIFRVKGRPLDNPLIVHCAAIEDIGKVAADIPPIAWELLRRFAPGPLTLVLHRRDDVPPIVSAGLPTIAVRVPALEVTRELIAAVGVPLVAPSANRSGRPSPTRAEHVLEDFDGHIAAVLDAGLCSIGIESTVLSLVGTTAIARPGVITAADLATILGYEPPLLDHGTESAPIAPGMKYRHYAPTAPVILIESLDHVYHRADANVVVLSTQPISGMLNVRPLRAATLYDEFRRADREGREAIYVLLTPDIRTDAALMNRLQKAAASSRLGSQHQP
jgi:L-threonylcarbamoyladenylate synthase